MQAVPEQEDAAVAIYELDVTQPVTEATAADLSAIPFFRTLLGLAARMLVVSRHTTVSLKFDDTNVFVLKKPAGSGPLAEQVADDFLDSLDKDSAFVSGSLEEEVYDHDTFPHEGQEDPASHEGSEEEQEEESETDSEDSDGGGLV
jgi:hypothetical protein